MATEIAVAYYPEGTGHATRMLAVADALRTAGADVSLAGGGDGAIFTELNGFDQFEPTEVDFIDTYQRGSPLATMTRSVPKAARRTAEFFSWFRRGSFDAVLTDDMFAAKAAAATGLPLYVVKHDMPGMYDDPIQRAGAAFHVYLQRSIARRFFFPTVCPPSPVDATQVTRVPPLALEDGGRSVRAADVVLVPSQFSIGLETAADRLQAAGLDTLLVGGDDWEPVPVLLPYIRGADAVVCAGYSTVMEAAVAGTPCVIRPETDEQEGVGRWLERSGTGGFEVVRDLDAIVETALDPPQAPSFENGASAVAETVLGELEDRGRRDDADAFSPVVPPFDSPRPGQSGGNTRQEGPVRGGTPGPGE